MAVLVTRHADVAACLRNPALSSAITPGSLAGSPVSVFNTYAAVLRRQMDLVDPPRHTQLRRLFGPAFGAAPLQRLSAFAGQWVDTRLRALPDSFDVIAEIARPLPFVVVMELLGVPSELRPAFARDIECFVTGLADPVAAHASVSAALDSLRASLSAALERPDLEEHSVLSIARQLDFDDLMANVILMAAAGHQTTTNLIGNGAWLLLTHPDQRSLIASQPAIWTTAIEEMLRFESPIQSVRRTCTEAITIGSQPMTAGDDVILVLGAANRDPAAFGDADRFDVTRTPNPHLAFGGGAHACPGAQLARLQARAALGGLFALPALRAIDDAAAWVPSAGHRGLERLIVERS